MSVKDNRNVKHTLSTQAIEGITPSRQVIRLCKKLSDGTVTADAAVEAIKSGLIGERLRDLDK